MRITEIIDEALKRRGLIKGLAGAGAAATVGGLGAGVNYVIKRGEEIEREEQEFLSKVTDPEDVKKYTDLSNTASNYLAMAGGNMSSPYYTLYQHKRVQVNNLRDQLNKKYGIE